MRERAEEEVYAQGKYGRRHREGKDKDGEEVEGKEDW